MCWAATPRLRLFWSFWVVQWLSAMQTNDWCYSSLSYLYKSMWITFLAILVIIYQYGKFGKNVITWNRTCVIVIWLCQDVPSQTSRKRPSIHCMQIYVERNFFHFFKNDVIPINHRCSQECCNWKLIWPLSVDYGTLKFWMSKHATCQSTGLTLFIIPKKI